MQVENRMPMLSIVIPCYNAANYIQQAVKNIEKQKFTDWEAIFVNDGSTDETGKLLDEILAGKDKFKVIHKSNGGTANTRNKGMEAASGKYITFFDADDELSDETYGKLVYLMEKTDADIGICGFFFKLENKKSETSYLEEKKYPSSLYKSKDEIKEHLVDMWDSDILSNVWNKIYRKDLIKEKSLKYRDGHVYTEDRVFNRQFIENCNSIVLTDECLYFYVRERAGSTSEKYREDYFDIRQKEYVEFQEHFKKMDVWNEKAKEYVCREFIERISGCIENLFHAEGILTKKQKKIKIKEIINNQDVCDAAKFAKCRSKKMRLLIYPIKTRNTKLTYLVYDLVYQVRKLNPALFHKLKGTR